MKSSKKFDKLKLANHWPDHLIANEISLGGWEPCVLSYVTIPLEGVRIDEELSSNLSADKTVTGANPVPSATDEE